MRIKSDNPCAEAIKKTIAYRSYFKYPLTEFQLKTVLIGNQKFGYKHFHDELVRLLKKGTVKSRNKLYYGPGFKPVDWQKRADISRSHIKTAENVCTLLSVIPWIRLVGVTGSVSAYNAEKESDVDIFIITAKNRVWITRFFAVLILKTIGKYRTDKTPGGKICPNIFVDENNMSWPTEKRNLFVATEIIMMHPLINKDNTYFRLIKANQWIFDYYKGFNISFGSLKDPKTNKKTSGLVGSMENILRILQKKYMKSKKTTEVTNKGVIHFNREDWTEKILERYEDNLKKFLGK